MLEVENISKTFSAGIVHRRVVRAVADVSFAIPEQKTFGIVGNSGCGKTTIARMLLSLTKPDSGRILIDGENILTAEARERKNLTRKIQIIFQHPESSLDPGRKIGYSLREPMRIHRLYSPVEQENRLRYLLDLVELDEKLLDRYPHQISGGEAQRLMIARALTLDPAILVLDEPTSMLDVSIQAQVMRLLRELQQQLKLSYLFISHDIGVVRWFCDEIAVMKDGRFLECGPAQALLEHPQEDFTKELLESYCCTLS